MRVTYGLRATAPRVDAVVTHVRETDTWNIEPMSERLDWRCDERKRVSYLASSALFDLHHDDLAALLMPQRKRDWLLVDLTVDELRSAFRRRAVRENDDLWAGLTAWGTADAPVRVRRDLATEDVLKEFRAVVEPQTDYVVQALAGRVYLNPPPSRTELHDILSHALALQAVGARYGERGRKAAVRAVWDYLTADEFEAGLADATELIEHFSVDGEPIAELLEAGLPEWAYPLIG
ncbi:Uncharacterised protein [Mycobacteroides abscessus subsp. abscessus]|nr:Uncharacterised protein [Mycobacteroides abscessus subsp. abscessus]SIG65397.1 Uncharacterised protein [Mycobacteroides abscessus subsp. abscessus]